MKALGPTPGLPLFIYGTLLDPALTGGLLEREVEPETARLLDFELGRLAGLATPAVFEAPGETVAGGLLRGLASEDWERLDAYEGVAEELYMRIQARAVSRRPDSDPEPVFVYVLTPRTLRRYGSA